MSQRIEPSGSEDESKVEKPSRAVVASEPSQFIVPDDKKNLQACLMCGLIKTKCQWFFDRHCENCGTFKRLEASENITKKFDGLIGLIDPKKSFIRKKAFIYSRNGNDLKPAAYGI